jgi:hypothetical protein
MVKGGIALMAEVPEAAVEVTVIEPVAPWPDRRCPPASQAAAQAAEPASKPSRQAVEQWRSEKMTVREVGGLIGVSPQRVSHLA